MKRKQIKEQIFDYNVTGCCVICGDELYNGKGSRKNHKKVRLIYQDRDYCGKCLLKVVRGNRKRVGRLSNEEKYYGRKMSLFS